MDNNLSSSWIAILVVLCSISAASSGSLNQYGAIELGSQEANYTEVISENFTVEMGVIDDSVSDYTSYDVRIDSDSIGNIHVLYKPNYTLMTLATMIDGVWVNQNLNIKNYTIDFDMVIDSNDSVHISWQNSSNRDLMYTTNSSGDWVTTAVDTSGRKGGANSITVDSNNNPHILYRYGYYNGWYEDYSYYLRYATISDEGLWEIETIAYPSVRRDTSEEFGGVFQTDITVDTEDKIHASYVIYDAKTGIADTNGLWYVSGTSGNWVKEHINTASEFFSPSIDVGSQNKAHIAYEGLSGEIIHTYKNENNTWVSSIMDNSSIFSDPSIVIDVYEIPHITYIDASSKNQKYALLNSDYWQTYNVSTETSYTTTTAMELSQSGSLHTALMNWTGSPYHTLIQYPDVDSDGVSVLNDLCPNEGNQNFDSDRDGCIDDEDNDGVYDNLDTCPNEDSSGFDTDNDGCIDDSDGDGVGDNLDVFPNDSTEVIDTDDDGVGDNSDRCEGYNDSIDVDNDGIVDGCDDLLDNDGDGVSNQDDVFPEDSTETVDNDEDGVGDNSDSDIDGDGVENELDDFPYDKLRNKDTDGDGEADFVEGMVSGELIDFESGNYNGVNMHCADDLVGFCMPDYSPWVITNESISGAYSLEQQLWASDTGHFSVSFSSASDDVVKLQVYITSVIIENQCMPIYLDDISIDYGCDSEGFGYYDNITINVTRGAHVLKIYGTILGGGNLVDNIQLPDYVVASNEDLDDDNDGWGDSIEMSFSEDSPCYSDSLDADETPESNIEQTMYLGASPINYQLWEGFCQIYYDSDDDGIVDYYSTTDGYVSVDRCPDEFGYDVGEWVVNETTGASEFNMDEWGCPLKSADSAKGSANEDSFMTYGIGFGVILVIILVVFFIRKGGDSVQEESVKDYVELQEEEQVIESPPSLEMLSTGPPENATGMLNDDGYYWIEWPIASGEWYYRLPDESPWNLFKKQ